MKYFAMFDRAGLPVGFWIEGFGDVPEAATEITREQHAEMVTYQGARRWQDGQVVLYEPPAAPPPVPSSISRQQCAMQMCAMGLITPAEMVAMAKDGTSPTLVETLLTQMPEPDQSFARAAFAKANYSRTDPLLVKLMTSQPVPDGAGGKRPETEADIDQFFRDAAER